MNEWLNIGKNSLIYWIGIIVPTLSSVFLLPIYTRYLSPTDYGILAMLAAIAAPFAILMTLQLNTAVLRFFFDYDGEERRRYMGTIFLFLLLYSFPICLGLILFGQPLFEKIFKSEELTFYPFIVWQLIITFLSLAWIIPSALFKARQEAKKWVACGLSGFVMGTAFTIYFIVIQKEGAVGCVKASLISASIMFLVYLVIIRKNISFNFSGYKLKESLIFCMPLLPNAVLGYSLGFTDRWFLEHYCGLAEVGLYSIAFTFGHGLGMLYTASGDAWMPVFFNTANRNEGQANALLARTVTLWAAGGGLIALAIALFSREIIMVLTTPKFYPAYAVVPFLVFNFYLMGIRFYPRYGLLFVKKTKAILMITLACAGTNVLANFMLVPNYGMFGAAGATLIASGAGLAMTYLVVQKYYPSRFEYGKLLKIVGSGLVIFLITWYIAPESILYSILIKLSALLIFLISILYFKIITMEQVKEGYAELIAALKRLRNKKWLK